MSGAKLQQQALNLANFNLDVGHFSPSVIEKIDKWTDEFYVVSVLGSARQGKSTLLNMLATICGEDLSATPMFLTSPDQESCTSGLWTAPRLLKLSDNCRILLVDAEGADRAGEKRDLAVFSCAMLFSHVCIYMEPTGVISLSSVKRLSGAVEVAQNFATDEKGTKLLNDSKLRQALPALLWSIRCGADVVGIENIEKALRNLKDDECRSDSDKDLCERLVSVFDHYNVDVPLNKEGAKQFREDRKLDTSSPFYRSTNDLRAMLMKICSKRIPYNSPKRPELRFSTMVSVYGPKIVQGTERLSILSVSEMLKKHLIQTEIDKVVLAMHKRLEPIQKKVSQLLKDCDGLSAKELKDKWTALSDKVEKEMNAEKVQTVVELDEELKKKNLTEPERDVAKKELGPKLDLELLPLGNDVLTISKKHSERQTKDAESRGAGDIEIARITNETQRELAKWQMIAAGFTAGAQFLSEAGMDVYKHTQPGAQQNKPEKNS